MEVSLQDLYAIIGEQHVKLVLLNRLLEAKDSDKSRPDGAPEAVELTEPT